MPRHPARSALAAAFLGSLLASCIVPTSSGPDDTLPGECAKDSDCTGSDSCKTWRCEHRGCVEENAPAGALAASSYTAPPCHRFVCDGHGGEVLELDLSAKPNSDGEACHRLDCDSSGNVVKVLDPTVMPPDTQGNCKLETCDASGNITHMPDPTDKPKDQPGDCAKGACDADSNPVTLPADDPPTAVCKAYTCQNGQAVGTPANQGKSCSSYGLVCGASGQCDACPVPDAACTDAGPAAGSDSLGKAHDLGSIGFCDYNGNSLCGALKSGVTAYLRYISDGSFSFCDFDPFVSVHASAPVTLCEYFDCPGVICPSGTTESNLSGAPGCCAVGGAPSLKIQPSCVNSQVHITVEAQAPSCTSYLLDFHT